MHDNENKKDEVVVEKSFGLVLSLMISLLVINVQAAEGIILRASEELDASGQIVTIAIQAENLGGTEGGQFILNYDPVLVRPVDIEVGELVESAASGLHMANLDYAEGQLMFIWITAAADTAEAGDICFIQFELLNEGKTRLTFEDIIISPDEMIIASPVAGKITVDDSWVEQEKKVQNEDLVSMLINNTAMVVGLIVLAVMAAIVYLVLKQRRSTAPRE